jgi:hypothetical protein
MKYRVWNSDSNKWEREVVIDTTGKPYFRIGGKMGGTVCGVSKLTVPALHISSITGLRDKMGAEIYEGDIIRGLLNLDNLTIEIKLAQVIFRNGCFIDSYWHLPISHHNKITEVVGDIYEGGLELEGKDLEAMAQSS